MRVGVACGLVAAVGALLALVSPAPGGELAPRTIDRTYRCSTLVDAGGRRSVRITASPRSQFSKAQFALFAYGKRAESGWPLVDVYAPGPGSPVGQHGVWLNVDLCRAVKHSFRLSPSGLSGTPASTYVAERCDAGRVVLVRLRVEFAPWRGWRRFPARAGPPRAPAHERGYGKPKSASFAVRADGRPIAYAMFDPRGRTQLVTVGGPRCKPG